MMRKITPVFFLFFFAMSSVFSQNVSGIIADTTNKKNIENAVVALLTPVDSVLYKFTRTNKDGLFKLEPVVPGKYILMVTHPYFADIVDDVKVGENGLQMNQVSFIPKSKLLQEVVIKTGSPIRIKGDTISYTADSFKVSANANVEELLRKLPGIQVDKDGKIKAMGEQVQKVLVDGEEFFGDDPGMAVKNLRADAVKEVQVFDKKSEQAEFTGIDDGQKQKTINLKMKEDRKKGYFGKVDAAGGLLKKVDNRYNTNLMFNAFKGKRKISAFFLNGNTGQDGLNWQDNEKFGGENENISMSMDDDGGMMFMWRGGGSDDEPYINPENGFINNINAGLHYSNKWDDKKTLMISPKYNRQLYDNLQTNFTQRQVGDSVLNDYSTLTQNVSRYNIKNSVSYEIKFDSSNSLKVTGKANFYHTESSEERHGQSISNTGTLKNTTDRLLNQNSDKDAFSGSAIFRHKFKKLRRTLSVNADWNSLGTESKNYLKSTNQTYSDGLPAFSQEQNQMYDVDKSTQKLAARAVYTEPLGEKLSLEVGYEYTYSKGKNNQVTNSYSPLSGKYDEYIDTLSNLFDQVITVNKPTARFSYKFKKIKFNFGSGFGITNFDFKDVSYGNEYKREYTNIYPSASFNYSYQSNHNLNFNYNGNTSQPSLDQLQPLRNNNDIFNQYLGNPDLKQSFTHSFNVSHNAYNFIKNIWMYQSFNVRSTMNSLTNSINIDLDSGKTVTRPINTNGNLSMNFWSGFGFKIKKLDMNVDLNPNANYSKFADVINGRTSFSKTLNAGMGLRLSKFKEKKYDFSIGDEFSYNSNRTSQTNAVNTFYTNVLRTDATVYYKKSWSIRTDYSFFARQKTEQFRTNLTNHIWNARLQKTFKENEFTAYVMMRDILSQNIGIERNYYGNTTSEVTNQRLKQYWMIGFTWDFKNKAPKASSSENK
jgi:hypothetical protein